MKKYFISILFVGGALILASCSSLRPKNRPHGKYQALDVYIEVKKIDGELWPKSSRLSLLHNGGISANSITNSSSNLVSMKFYSGSFSYPTGIVVRIGTMGSEDSTHREELYLFKNLEIPPYDGTWSDWLTPFVSQKHLSAAAYVNGYNIPNSGVIPVTTARVKFVKRDPPE